MAIQAAEAVECEECHYRDYRTHGRREQRGQAFLESIFMSNAQLRRSLKSRRVHRGQRIPAAYLWGSGLNFNVNQPSVMTDRFRETSGSTESRHLKNLPGV